MTRAPWTLRRRLVVSVASVVTVILIGVGVVSAATLGASVTTVVNNQLAGSMLALEYSVDKYKSGKTGPDGKRWSKDLVDFVGHGPGTLIALIRDGKVEDSALFSSSDAVVLDADVEAAILADTAAPGIHNQELPGLGEYRIQVQENGPGEYLVAGVSLAVARQAVLQQTLTFVALTALALVLTILSVILVLRVALRPLNRVAQAAQDVVALQLDRGDSPITVRLGTEDTDPRTEVGKVGDALNRLLAHVDSAFAVRAETDKRMRRFVTDASHELRTPLAAILGYAELTRQDTATLPDLTEYSLARIESEATRMSSLVADLLLLARLDEGQDLQLDEVDLSEVALNAVSDARAAAPAFEWVADVPEHPVLIRGDHERVHQVVANLLSNARVHTPEGTTVTVRVESVGPEVDLRVIDNGPGVPPELVPELFQRFARGDASRSRDSGSTGLGLAIVESVVEAHGGRVSLEPSTTGATFLVVFPSAG